MFLDERGVRPAPRFLEVVVPQLRPDERLVQALQRSQRFWDAGCKAIAADIPCYPRSAAAAADQNS